MIDDEGLNVFGHLFGFWMFVFNREFRENWLVEFWDADVLGKCIGLFNAILATVIGLAIPVLVSWVAFKLATR